MLSVPYSNTSLLYGNRKFTSTTTVMQFPLQIDDNKSAILIANTMVVNAMDIANTMVALAISIAFLWWFHAGTKHFQKKN